MNLNLIANKKQDDIQAILYCAILFGDMKSISRILHPKGRFMGMTKLRFIFSFKQHEFLDDGKENNEMDEEYIFSDLISLHNYPGQRCYMLPMNTLNGGEIGAYVFIMHPEERDKVCLILETGIFQEEKHFLSSALMFRKSEAKKYNLLFKN